MNIINFNYKNDKKVRTQLINSDPYFCLKDCCKILKLNNHHQVLLRLDEKGVFLSDPLATYGGKQRLNFINEPNLYRVIFRSDKPEAKQFQNWVFEEVLPQLRKTGSYSIQPKKDIFRYAIDLCETKIGKKIHTSVIEFLKNHEYYRDGKVYNSCHMYDNFESWFLSSHNHNENCINYFQFISSMRNLGFIKGQAPLGWDILVYREIIKTREDIKLDNTKLKYLENCIENCNKNNEGNEYNIDNKWVEVNENKNREEIKTDNISKISININNNNIIRKSGKIIINGNSLDPVEKMLLRKKTARSYLKIAYKEKDINPNFYKIIQERVVKLYGTDKI